MIKDAFELRFGDIPWFQPKFDLSFTDKDGGDFSEENIVVMSFKTMYFSFNTAILPSEKDKSNLGRNQGIPLLNFSEGVFDQLTFIRI